MLLELIIIDQLDNLNRKPRSWSKAFLVFVLVPIAIIIMAMLWG